MSLKHFSHEHPLILRKEVETSDGGDEKLCYGCNQPILPPSAGDGDGDVYICGGFADCNDGPICDNDDDDDDDDDGISNVESSSNDDATCDEDGDDGVAIPNNDGNNEGDADAVSNNDGNDDSTSNNNGTCGNFYLHRKCAELGRVIQHPMHNPHPLTLLARQPYVSMSCFCNICGRKDWKWFTYSCYACEFDLCITCAGVGDRSFTHIGHPQHTLSLIRREALFKCDACGTEARDLSYACNSCDFWMHKTCASSETTVEADFIHRHPLLLTYSLPEIHRTFFQKCRLCGDLVCASYWLYYCHQCTYFAHIKCIAKALKSVQNVKSEAEAQKDMQEDDLILFPVDSKESFINFKKGITASGQHLQTPINHWSHKDHPLELMQEIVGSEDVEEIMCDGCIQPITQAADHPFYGCIVCNFFLHLFCLQLPHRLPAGDNSPHPPHPLVLSRHKNKFGSVVCNTCGLRTNGFNYRCKTCNHIRFDIRCCFLPKRIKHKSHNHPLLHSAPSHFHCNACDCTQTDEDVFECERMGCNFQIYIQCALLPGTMSHRWDPNPIPLIYPHLDHQGLIYCEICEYEIDTNDWLYHCCECDHSFHTHCLRPYHNMKVGDNKLLPGLHKHTLTFVVKKKQEHHGTFSCSRCSRDFVRYIIIVFECLNCEELFCVKCVSRNL